MAPPLTVFLDGLASSGLHYIGLYLNPNDTIIQSVSHYNVRTVNEFL